MPVKIQFLIIFGGFIPPETSIMKHKQGLGRRESYVQKNDQYSNKQTLSHAALKPNCT